MNHHGVAWDDAIPEQCKACYEKSLKSVIEDFEPEIPGEHQKALDSGDQFSDGYYHECFEHIIGEVMSKTVIVGAEQQFSGFGYVTNVTVIKFDCEQH